SHGWRDWGGGESFSRSLHCQRPAGRAAPHFKDPVAAMTIRFLAAALALLAFMAPAAYAQDNAEAPVQTPVQTVEGAADGPQAVTERSRFPLSVNPDLAH